MIENVIHWYIQLHLVFTNLQLDKSWLLVLSHVNFVLLPTSPLVAFVELISKFNTILLELALKSKGSLKTIYDWEYYSLIFSIALILYTYFLINLELFTITFWLSSFSIIPSIS